MKLSSPAEKRQIETVLPLINIVFLLLIFFMLAGSFRQHDLLSIEAPTAAVETQADFEQLTIQMSHDGLFAVDDTHYSEAELMVFLQQQASLKQQSPKQHSLLVQLKADQRVKSQDLIKVLESLGTTGLASVHLLVLESETIKNQ